MLTNAIGSVWVMETILSFFFLKILAYILPLSLELPTVFEFFFFPPT